jgi:hypothetical protein
MKINKNFKTKKMKIILKREGNPSGAEERSYRNLFGKDGESRVTKGRINSVNQIAWLFGRTEDTIIAGLLKVFQVISLLLRSINNLCLRLS